MWVTAALGLLIGAGFYGITAAATFTTVFALMALRFVEVRTPPAMRRRHKPENEPEEPDG
jgi:uncharacterized membrane protein YhiD involved in acid resistance